MESQIWKILVADDDPDDRAIIQEAMETLDAGKVLCFAETVSRPCRYCIQPGIRGTAPPSSSST